MLRFLLPAFALSGALLVLFAGALNDRLGSSGAPDTLPRFANKSPEPLIAQPPSDAQRPAPADPGTGQPPNKQQATSASSQRQVDALQQQATALQQQLAQRSKELEQRTKELQQRTRDVQATQAEADRLNQSMDVARQQHKEHSARLSQLAARSAELDQRSKELEQRTKELQQRTRDVQSAQAENDRLKQQGMDSARQRQEDGAKLSQLAARSAELEQRSQELEARKRELDKRSHDADAAQAEALRLRQVVDAIRQQSKVEPATLVRPKADEAPSPRQRVKPPSPAAPTAQESSPPRRPPDAPAPPAQQLITARQWLAAGRPDEARRLLTAAQPQMALQPVTPDAPDAQGASVPATDVGNAIRWLDMGANQQAMQAISHAIEAVGEPVGRVRAWSGYQAYSSSGYSQPFTPR
jgi:hypothetical protein